MVDQSVARLLTGTYGAQGESVLGPHARQGCGHCDFEHVTRALVGGRPDSWVLVHNGVNAADEPSCVNILRVKMEMSNYYSVVIVLASELRTGRAVAHKPQQA